MTLMLHKGAEPIEFDQLRTLPTPEATATHHPLPHAEFCRMVKFSLEYFGHEVVSEDYGVTPDGSSFFGAISLKSDYGDYTDICGLRNDHQKRFPAMLALGSRTFVCDNLAMVSDEVVTRRHTKNLLRDLPGLIHGMIQPLHDRRQRQHECFDLYQSTQITDTIADQVIMRMYRDGVINVQRIADVLGNFENPPHDYGDKSAWRLFQATTLALEGRVLENPQATKKLHDIIDGVCHELAA